MENKFTTLDMDEVIHVRDNASPLRNLAPHETCKVQVLLKRLESNFIKQLLDGVECEVIRLDQPGWQKGKIRIKKIELEFCPEAEESEQTDSPLDELRNTPMN